MYIPSCLGKSGLDKSGLFPKGISCQKANIYCFKVGDTYSKYDLEKKINTNYRSFVVVLKVIVSVFRY